MRKFEIDMYKISFRPYRKQDYMEFILLPDVFLQFSFDVDSPYTIADFRVTWGPLGLPLDNPSGIQGKMIFFFVWSS